MSGVSAGGCGVDIRVTAGEGDSRIAPTGEREGQRINGNSVGLASAGEGPEALLQDFHEDSVGAFWVDP